MKDKEIVFDIGAVLLIIIVIVATIINIFVFPYKGIEANADVIVWEGNGTKKEPYLISSIEDLIAFRDAVNAGEGFENTYFLQTCDIDLGKDTKWIPIGEYGLGNYFYGTYDGGCHTISNMYVNVKWCSSVNVGFFGMLCGKVYNLGIESGHVKGWYIGGIASHGTGKNVAIINCYNKATIEGEYRAGGIADNFSGDIINCINYGETIAPINAGIVSYFAENLAMVYATDKIIPDERNLTVQYHLRVDKKTDMQSLLNIGVDSLNYANVADGLIKYWQ